jgi:hypothetical protein
MVQTLRKRGKYVIGIGVKHTTSQNLASECDQYIHYEELLPTQILSSIDIDGLIDTALNDLLKSETKVRASILKQRMDELSNGAFIESPESNGSFRKFLERFPEKLTVIQEETTLFVIRASHAPEIIAPTQTRQLHQRYRSELKKRRLRVVPSTDRLKILNDIIRIYRTDADFIWKQLVETLFQHYSKNGTHLSKNLINDTMLVARRAEILQTQKGRSLASATLSLNLPDEKPLRQAIILCDVAYLKEIIDLAEPFEIDEASLALYESPQRAAYLQTIIRSYELR